MKKGFLASALLLSSLTIIYYTSLTQTITIQQAENTQNHVKLNQKTQENKYRYTQGFKDTVKQSLKSTEGEKPIKRELKACEALQQWMENLKKEEDREITLKSGYINPENYHYQEEMTLAFNIISNLLRKDPSQALGNLEPRAIACINYLSIPMNQSKAIVKDNGYMKQAARSITNSKPVFLIEINLGSIKQKIIIPSNTVIRLKVK